MIPSNTTVRDLILFIKDKTKPPSQRQVAAEQLIEILEANPNIYNALAPQNIHTIQNILED